MKKILIIAVVLLASIAVNAQKNDGLGKRKQIEAQKVTYITQSLDLSPEEAQYFWPLYNEMKKKQHSIYLDMRNIHKSCKKKAGHKCEDAQILLKCDSLFVCEKLLLDNKIEYYNKFKLILPARKVHKLLNIEKNFNKKLLKRLGRHRGNRQGRP